MKRTFSFFPFVMLLALSALLAACGLNAQASQHRASSSTTSQNITKPGVYLTDEHRLDMVNEKVGWAIGGGQDQNVTSGFDYSTLLHTTDSGKHWQQAYYSVNGLNGVYVLGEQTAWIFVGPPQIPTLYQVTSLYRTVDGGKTWQEIPAPSGLIPFTTTFIDASHGWVVSDPCGDPKALGYDQYLKLCEQSTPLPASLLQTSDGGKTWKKVDTSFDISGIEKMQFLDQQTGFALFGSQFTAHTAYLSVTHDGGHTWERQLLQLPTPAGISQQEMNQELIWVPDLTFLNKQDGYLIAALVDQVTRNYLYVTHDGGKTWQVSGPTFSNDDMGSILDSVLDAQHVVLESDTANGGFQMLLLTLQNGKWVTTAVQPAGNDALVDGDFVSPQMGIALVANKSKIDVYKTDDGAKDWQKIGTL